MTKKKKKRKEKREKRNIVENWPFYVPLRSNLRLETETWINFSVL